jgi:drug/metabolite transporter (DMT)-like permease
MLWVLLMFGEPITPLALVGLLVSAAGVLLVVHGRRGRATRPPRDARNGSNQQPAGSAALHEGERP